MAERKRWDKQHATRLAPGATGSTSANADAKTAADPVLTKQRQYIKILEERNRVKKRLAAASKSQQRKDRLQEREEAFVTAFNVPARTTAVSGHQAEPTRKTKSAATLLPTRMEHHAASSRSAPGNTLNFAPGHNGVKERSEQPRTRRAKWSRPQAPMNVAVEHHDGIPRFRLTCGQGNGKEEEKELQDEEEGDLPMGGKTSSATDSDKDEEENYSEESFEDFEEDEDTLRDRQRGVVSAAQAKDLVLEEMDLDEGEGQSNLDVARKSAVISPTTLDDPGSPADFSTTTKELVSMIQHLSRSKQRALVGVLQKFQSSDQLESDVKELRSSIGDPDIWKQITSTLGSTQTSSPASPPIEDRAVAKAEAQKVVVNRDLDSGLRLEEPSVAPLKHLLEEQLRWEDEYTREMKVRFAVEREKKQHAIRKAEARRAKMMEQMEEEERELERLMEAKRHARLAKLRALEQEVEDEDEVAISSQVDRSVRDTSEAKTVDTEDIVARAISQSALKDTPAAQIEDHYVSEVDELLFIADAKCTSIIDPVNNDSDSGTDEKQAILKPSPVVPGLKLPLESDTSEVFQIGVKLLSTWGHTRAVGLTQICAYDCDGKELEADLDSLRLYEQTNGKPLSKTNEMVRGLKKLFNGVAHTNAEKDMWLGRLTESGVLQIAFEVAFKPSKLCIWNYNSKFCTACARDIEVLVQGKCVWSGSLPETFGDRDGNACTWIDLLSSGRKTSRTDRRSSEGSSEGTNLISLSARVTDYDSHRNRDSQASAFKKGLGGAPVWLAGSSSSSSSTSTAHWPLTDQPNSSSEMCAADEKASYPSGSQTSRRRKTNVSRSGADAWSEAVNVSTQHTDDAKPRLSHAICTENEEKRRPQHKLPASNCASLSSWDSLENFSKTSRSRIALPTSVTHGVHTGLEAKQPEPVVQKYTTTSALLFELRTSTTGSGFSAMHSTSAGSQISTEYEAAHLLPDFPSAQTPSSRNISGDRDVLGEIPVLPSGRWLRIEILSTWGDPHYVGLNGVELFDHRGELVTFHDPEQQITASPESINILEENTDDPRVPKNLVDGTNFTCDDLHMWLAPFTPGALHHVLLRLDGRVALSMVRIWNYNKSRTHTCRGVRGARLVLYDSLPTHASSRLFSEAEGDSTAGTVIFEGEIRQAPGLVGEADMDSSNEVILFTQETAILQAIEANDAVVRTLVLEQQREEEEAHAIEITVRRSMALQRPRTSDNGSRTVGCSPKNQERHDVDQQHLRLGTDGRPLTTATRVGSSSGIGVRTSIDSWVAEEPQERSPVMTKETEGVVEKESMGEDIKGENGEERQLLRGRRLTLQLISTWGDRNYIGLTQIQVLVGTRGTPLPLDASNIDATPRDLASLGYTGDPRTLDKLLDGEGATCDDTHMWLVPLHSAGVPEIRIDLKQAQFLYGLRVWNYNKSTDDSSRGVKQLRAVLDGVVISPAETGFLVRKAPGVAHFDFGQLLPFPSAAELRGGCNDYLTRIHYPFQALAYKTPLVRQDYEAPLYPQGFLLKIVCWTTWGDPFYLGLNGFELYDFCGARITEAPTVMTAVPYSVAELVNAGGSKQNDSRVPANLVNGRDKNTWEAHDAWLAPLASSLGSSRANIIYVGFDTPVVLSMIKFWNYSKTPERGVKDLDVYLDDLHIFSGTLRRAPPPVDAHAGFSKVHRVIEQFGQPILFSASQAQVDAEKRSIVYCGAEEQDILAINEGQVMRESRSMYRKPDPGAEGVVVDLERRPMTAVCRQ